MKKYEKYVQDYEQMARSAVKAFYGMLDKRYLLPNYTQTLSEK